jgi:catechol 2,3-dioxygenase-like lactoylglutathione lyase family enzyme
MSIDMKLEVTSIPVSDVERSKTFYSGLGWRLDADFAGGSDFRVVQFNPPGSSCSIHFGKGLTSAAPGSAALYLVVSDIVAARAELAERGADVSDVFHRAGPGKTPVNGPDPERRSYSSFATFKDPDGNMWLLQEITARLPGRIDGTDAIYSSPSNLAQALRRAEAAHGEHEKKTGVRDANWSGWYADYMVAEQTGKPLPT